MTTPNEAADNLTLDIVSAMTTFAAKRHMLSGVQKVFLAEQFRDLAGELDGGTGEKVQAAARLPGADKRIATIVAEAASQVIARYVADLNTRVVGLEEWQTALSRRAHRRLVRSEKTENGMPLFRIVPC
jgi:hypothetical protein